MTASVMFNVAQGEKQLLSLINATVSHEMRNPINSISNQIL
jgi:signal transduction histidine kinase